MPENRPFARPSPPRGVRELAEEWRTWCSWIGTRRIVGVVAGAVAVAVALAMLLRAGPPPTESTLPFVSTSVATEIGTTVVPSSVVVPPADTGHSSPGSAVVHVAGSVARPGVYTIDQPGRVVDAIDAAGGAVDEADLDGLNLAAPLVDGQRVYVPSAGEVDPRSVPSGPSDGSPPSTNRTPVDLNRATVEELDALPGIGPATAAAIVGDRDANGPFSTVDDLERVPGIGPAKLTALRDLLVV